jgi:hypothetical protein
VTDEDVDLVLGAIVFAIAFVSWRRSRSLPRRFVVNTDGRFQLIPDPPIPEREESDAT